MNLKSLFLAIGECCVRSPKPIVLMIDEADAAAEYEVFLDFLAQLRARYIKREQNPTFHSVIHAGVHDIKSLKRKNTLFDSLIDKVNRYPDLRECLYAILMKGSDMSYSPDIETIDVAQMYGFVKIVNSKVVIANRIFETRLYNFFLISEETNRGERDSFGR